MKNFFEINRALLAKKKIFTFALAALISASMLADTAVLSWQLGENGAYAESANAITGAAGSLAEGWTIAISGNESKNWSAGNGKIFLDPDSLMTLKNSNGAQNTVTLPEGLYASKVEFRVVTNHDDTKGLLSEFDGEACSDEVESLKDYDHPTVIVKELETPKNQFTFTFKTKQVCFIAIVTYSDEAPAAPTPYGLLSWQLGADGAEATAANSITGAAGSLAEGWTIAITGNEEKKWGAGSKLTFKGKQYKTLKNSNGAQNTVTLPEGLYAIDVEFHAVTNDSETNGVLKEFDGENTDEVVNSLKDYDNPTVIVKELATPKNQFTFTFGTKQVCFLAVVHYTENAQGLEEISTENKAIKIFENGQLVIIRDGVKYNALGVQL